jgi:hypothetical protein
MKLHVLLLVVSEVLLTGLRCVFGGVVNGLSVFSERSLGKSLVPWATYRTIPSTMKTSLSQIHGIRSTPFEGRLSLLITA